MDKDCAVGLLLVSDWATQLPKLKEVPAKLLTSTWFKPVASLPQLQSVDMSWVPYHGKQPSLSMLPQEPEICQRKTPSSSKLRKPFEVSSALVKLVDSCVCMPSQSEAVWRVSQHSLMLSSQHSLMASPLSHPVRAY